MALKLARRGVLALSLAVALLTLSAATADVLMLGMSLTLIAVLVVDGLSTYVTTSRARCTCASCGESYKTWVQKEVEVTVTLRCSRFLGVVGSPSWARVVEVAPSRDQVGVSLKLMFKFYGKYRPWLEVLRGGFLGFFKVVERVDLGSEFVVYPETLYWVLRALALLGLRGELSVEPSETYLPTPVDLGEYVGSREYHPGDSLRRVDWRSTAKFMKLYVKEFSSGEEPSETLLVDLRCIGRYTCDRIASAALSVAVARYGNGGSTALCRVDEGGCRVFNGDRDLLLHVLDMVLKLDIVGYDQLHEFVKPTTMSTLRKLLRGLNVGGRTLKWSELGDVGTVYVISTLLHDVRAVLDVVESAVGRGARCVVLTASRPWLDSRSLSEAYSIYRSFSNVVSALRSLGAEVVTVDRRW